MGRTASMLACAILLISIAGCGGHTVTTFPAPVLQPTLNLAPTAVALAPNASFTFTAVTSNLASAVTWTIQEGATGGAIDSAGHYVAPATPGTYHVVVTSVSDPSRSATATITVTTSIVPSFVNAGIGNSNSTTYTQPQATSIPLSAQVFYSNNSTTTDVVWSIQEGAVGGSIVSDSSGDGVYTAGATIGVFHLIAASRVDPTKFATITVTVVPLNLLVAPAAEILAPGESRTIYVGTSNEFAAPDVNWTIAEGSAGGSIAPGVVPGSVKYSSPSYVYTAPAAPGTYHLTASPSAAPGIHASVTVTVANSGYFVATPPQAPYSIYSPSGGATATLLQDGTVLATGGTDFCISSFCTPPTASSAAYVYSVGSDGSVTATRVGDLTVPRANHTAVLLNDGRVLVAGGESPAAQTQSFMQSAELYDPKTRTFSPTGSMSAIYVSYDIALPLRDGAAIIGGAELHASSSGTSIGPFSIQIYDPKAATFNSVTLPHNQLHSAVVALSDGRVAFFGGGDFNSSGVIAPSAEVDIFDPITKQLAQLGKLNVARDQACATLLNDGTVLVVGGITAYGSNSPVTASAEVFNVASGSSKLVGDMNVARTPSCATLPDGRALIVGGPNFGSSVLGTSIALSRTNEIYDPATGKFTFTGGTEFYPQSVPPRLIKMPNGLILATYGYPKLPNEVYRP